MTNTPAREGLPELPAEVAAAFRALTREDSTPEEIEARMFLMRHLLALAAIAGREAQGEAEWITGLRNEAMLGAMKDVFWLTRDQVFELIGKSAALPHPQPGYVHKCQLHRSWVGECPTCASGLPEKKFTPPPPSDAAQGFHVRHVGGGLLALYRGDEQVREIGVTPGWNFRDRDEFIARYNAHKGEGNG